MHVYSLGHSKPLGAIAASLAMALFCGSGMAQQQEQSGGNADPNGRHAQPDDQFTQYTGREHGSLGVSLTDNGRGDVWVRTVVPTSPADRAGVRPGDQIVALDNQAVHSYRDIVHFINQKGPHDRLAVHVLREGQVGTLTANLVPHQMLGGPNNNTSQAGGPGYYRHPQGHTETYVVPAPGYVGGNRNQPAFNTNQPSGYNAEQAGYNQNRQSGYEGQQAGNPGQQNGSQSQQNGYNGQQNGMNRGQGFRPMTISQPPLTDDRGSDSGIQPTGPTF